MQNIATGSEQTFQPKAQPRSPDDGRRYPSAGSGAARHSKTGFDSAKRNARGYSWSSTFTGSDARYLGFNYGFLARMASKTPDGRGFQLRCLQEHPKGVLLAIRRRKFQPSSAERHPDGREKAGRRLRENDTHRMSDGESGGPPARGGVGPSGPVGRS